MRPRTGSPPIPAPCWLSIREMGLSVNRVAQDIGLPATRLHEIVHQRRGVTAETAIALGVYFGQTPSSG